MCFTYTVHAVGALCISTLIFCLIAYIYFVLFSRTKKKKRKRKEKHFTIKNILILILKPLSFYLPRNILWHIIKKILLVFFIAQQYLPKKLNNL